MAKKWSDILDERFEEVVQAVQSAAREAADATGEAERRVLLHRDGTVENVWEFPNTITPEQRDGTARKVGSFAAPEDDETRAWLISLSEGADEPVRNIREDCDLLYCHWKEEDDGC